MSNTVPDFLISEGGSTLFVSCGCGDPDHYICLQHHLDSDCWELSEMRVYVRTHSGVPWWKRLKLAWKYLVNGEDLPLHGEIILCEDNGRLLYRALERWLDQIATGKRLGKSLNQLLAETLSKRDNTHDEQVGATAQGRPNG